MVRYECIYKSGKAGYLECKDVIHDMEKYQFIPSRSIAHLKLTRSYKKNRKPKVVLRSENTELIATVLHLSQRAIAVEKSQRCLKFYFKRLHQFFLKRFGKFGDVML